MGAELSSYLSDLQSKGRLVLASQGVESELSLSHGAFLDAAERLQKQKKLIRLRRGFYVIVPPQFSSWGAPPPSWYIDALMRHESCLYYVGLLKAAELHGATHQAVNEFQVVAAKRLPKMQVGRSSISFYYRKEIEALARGIEDHKTDTGSMKISSVELTALDLFRYPHASAGLDNIVTVLADLGGKINPEALARLSVSFQKSVVQRLGHLLDQLGYADSTRLMLQELVKKELPSWVELGPEEVADPQLTPSPIERDKRWNVVIRRKPEVDE
jgi:predicted transcriptional regulator of viral defense system